MTTEEKNLVLKLDAENKSKRAIARAVNKDPKTVIMFLDNLDPKIKHFSICPACKEEFIQYKGRGRNKIYCSDKCRHSIEIRLCFTCLLIERPFRVE